MSDNIIAFNGVTILDLPVERVIAMALAAGVTEITICGIGDDGADFFASTSADAGVVLYHLARAKHLLMLKVDELIEG